MMDGMGDSNPVDELTVEPHSPEPGEHPAGGQIEAHPHYHPAFDDVPTVSWRV